MRRRRAALRGRRDGDGAGRDDLPRRHRLEGCDVGAPAGSVCPLDVGGLAPGQRGSATFSVRVDPASSGAVVDEAVFAAGYGSASVRAATTTPIEPPAAVPIVVRPRYTG